VPSICLEVTKTAWRYWFAAITIVYFIVS